jgi:hypothetical protein
MYSCRPNITIAQERLCRSAIVGDFEQMSRRISMEWAAKLLVAEEHGVSLRTVERALRNGTP